MIEKLLKSIENMITGSARAPNKQQQISEKGAEQRGASTASPKAGETESRLPVTIEVKPAINVSEHAVDPSSGGVPSNAQHDMAELKQKTPRQIIVFRRLLLIAAIGVLLILVANIFDLDDKLVSTTVSSQQQNLLSAVETELQSDTSPFSAIEHALEQRTKSILEKMIGVGHVSVLITVESTEEQVIKTNTNESKSYTEEADKNGGVREVTTTTNDGQVVFMESKGEQEPVVTKVINPRIRGVLIVAEGAEDATVRKLIIQAVEKGLNVHQSKISVVPSKI